MNPSVSENSKFLFLLPVLFSTLMLIKEVDNSPSVVIFLISRLLVGPLLLKVFTFPRELNSLSTKILTTMERNTLLRNLTSISQVMNTN